MALTPLKSIRGFCESLAQGFVSILGAPALRALLKKNFSHGEVELNIHTELEIRVNKQDVIYKLLAVMVEQLVRNFGHAFAEYTLQRLYSAFLEHQADKGAGAEILAFVPDGFLEKEKIKRLSKEELETRVLERTKELQEVNAHLEQTVLERTKELVGANAQLEIANKDLKRLSQAKTDFLSLVSHQLLVPLSAMRWTTTELYQSIRSKLNDEDITLLETLLLHNERMARLIENLLNNARIEEGKIVYMFERVPLTEIIADVVSALAPLAAAKSITVVSPLTSDTIFVRADKEKLSLAIGNILDNAIKYTPEKETITITMAKDTTNVTLSIEDRGIGIPAQDHAHIFTKFFRSDNARENIKGSGLGLFIVKQIIEDHGGKIHFVSEEGKGAVFFIELPLVN